MQTQLLCTFTKRDELQTILEKIRQTYTIVYNYIYVLQNKSNLDELYITTAKSEGNIFGGGLFRKKLK